LVKMMSLAKAKFYFVFSSFPVFAVYDTFMNIEDNPFKESNKVASESVYFG